MIHTHVQVFSLTQNFYEFMTSCAVTSQITHYIIYTSELCKLNQLEQDTHKLNACTYSIHICQLYCYCAFKTCTSYYVCSCVGVAQNYTRTWSCILMLQMIMCLLVIKIHSFVTWTAHMNNVLNLSLSHNYPPHAVLTTTLRLKL